METETETKISTHFTQERRREVILATAVVKIKTKTGYCQFARALIDQGSEASFINEATVQALGLERKSVNGLITGVGDGETHTKSSVSFILESRYHSFTMPVEAFVLSTLTSFLPNNRTLITDWPEMENLLLADPQFGEPNRVDLILGVDILSEIFLEGLKKHPSKCGLIAQNTQLGWILSGRIGKTNTSNRIINLHLQLEEDQLLTKFWEIERGPENVVKKMTRDEKICEEFFEKTTTRDEEGRYIERLPFNEEDPQCFKGETKEIALRRFKLLERKLIKNPDLYDDYKKVIEDYIIQHHMIKVSDSEVNSRVFYLPHHAVIREDKETTKVRCVFDASCKGSNNVSLNSCFIIGPKLQQDLRHILMRWRLHPYCVVADIVQMYRQIRVHGDDSDCLRILWRFDPNKPIETYKHVRLPFGTSCAPYLAVKCLQQLAKDEKSKYPIAAKITLQDFYMDDLLTGGDDENEIIEIYDQMNKLMKAGGLCLQKWCTNSENLLNHIKADKIRSNQAVIFKENNMIKVLGICWNKNTDNFEYLHHVPEADMPITKRNVLSDIARLYDPLGWIAPVIITAKIYMQKLWKSGLAWDDNLTPDLLKEWYSQQKSHPFMGQLPSVRLKPERAFKSTGVDFTGFIKLRFVSGRGSKSYKGYICVFICMVTRAVHLEAVSNLSTEGFIAAFRRFVSRRCYCKDLYSDNGTNFVGADKELREMFNKAVSDFSKEIKTLLANEGTTWHYIPPQAPNFGGLWEACVRSTKYHLKRVIGDTTLTYEELSTLLTQIEACLNSRPLCPLSDSDVLPLTPGHFLIGEPLITIPDEDYSKVAILQVYSDGNLYKKC
ncbi:uncharacterized protein LOC124535923 [Vanessa cardui]|uniref:uncharacterized protein LOC124535923 n=1 Tax=Vanessa cardui TaxID=171605 RepID=UPI001F139592|nr:uncharacterized protein LOC124535923 [Vanessa cardui]